MELEQYPIDHIMETFEITTYFEKTGKVSENEWGQPVYGPIPIIWHATSHSPRREEATGASCREAVLAVAKKLME